MRGKHDTIVPAVRQYRITPAGAGKTHQTKNAMNNSQDHPRRCGENFACGAGGDVIKGSPPQVRGKLFDFVPIKIKLRITPAGAGKTKATLNERFVNQDHPRRCGENLTGKDPTEE